MNKKALENMTNNSLELGMATPSETEAKTRKNNREERNSFCITMEPDFREEVRKLAKEKHISFSALVSVALSEYIEAERIRKERGYQEIKA